MRFRKKPVEVEVEQWFWGKEVRGVWIDPAREVPSRSGGVAFLQPRQAYVVTIHQQRVYLQEGDYILPEPDGVHFYPVKPDIFAATYEPVEDET